MSRSAFPISLLESQWSIYVPTGLTFNNSTFCPHSVFACFVCILEQTAINSFTALTDWFL